MLVRTNAQTAPLADALEGAGIPVRRSESAAGSPMQAVIRQVAALGSASQLRAWAHDTLDAPSLDELANNRPRSRAHLRIVEPEHELDRRVAHAVLQFLRDSPLGDGAGFRAWVATTNPFDDGTTGGVEVLTFHASKGREWHTVVLAGVETSLVPHKSATTAVGKAEEGRLLYVAMTRATDRLLISHAQRRAGYARTPSPFLAGLATGEPEPARPPARHRRARVDPVLAALTDWRESSARRLDILPTELCTDRDLAAIAQPSSDDRRGTRQGHLVRSDHRATTRRPTGPDDRRDVVRLTTLLTCSSGSVRRCAPRSRAPMHDLQESRSTITGA